MRAIDVGGRLLGDFGGMARISGTLCSWRSTCVCVSFEAFDRCCILDWYRIKNAALNQLDNLRFANNA